MFYKCQLSVYFSAIYFIFFLLPWLQVFRKWVFFYFYFLSFFSLILRPKPQRLFFSSIGGKGVCGTSSKFSLLGEFNWWLKFEFMGLKGSRSDDGFTAYCTGPPLLYDISSIGSFEGILIVFMSKSIAW